MNNVKIKNIFFLHKKTSHNKNNDIHGSPNKINDVKKSHARKQ